MVVERARSFELTAHQGGRSNPRDDLVAVEEPLEIRVGGAPLAVIMRTPGHDLELAAGFLVAESILRTPDELSVLTHCPEIEHGDNVVEAHLAPGLSELRMSRDRERGTVVSSSCGVCGRRTLEQAKSRAPAFEGEPPRYTAALLTSLPVRLLEAQEVFRATGGLHGAGIFDPAGDAWLVREDIGRHNAVDKCIGERFLADRWPMSECILTVSGRAGFDIVEKALVARVRTVVSVSAPSSLAVELARASSMNLFGFVRGENLNVYAGALG